MEQKLCTGCGVLKPLDDTNFPKRKTKNAKGWRWDSWCRACYCANTKRINLKDPERKRKADREYHERTKDLRHKWNKRRWAEYNRRDSSKASQKEHRQRLKLEVMNAYGGPICICCGIDMIEFLTLDHLASDGKSHRKSLGGRHIGYRLYRWLRDNGYPPIMQVLCMNCNWARHWTPTKECPHLLASQELTGIIPGSTAHHAV